MNKIQQAQQILKDLGLPKEQQNKISALTLLALCGIKSKDDWSGSRRKSLGVTKGIMQFVGDNYERKYAANTRETFRREVLHQFEQARIVDYNPDNPSLPVNSPNAHYAITEAALKAIKTYGTIDWKSSAEKFREQVGDLSKQYRKERKQDLIPIRIREDKVLKLSAGKHNEVQKAIIDDFAPRYIHPATLLYVGDTAKKDLFIDEETLKHLHIPIDGHSKLPDVIIYDHARLWLYLFEAVTTHGPISPKRLVELEHLLKNCKLSKIYVSAFLTRDAFRKWMPEIAWETEVWIVEEPSHMIHFNGKKFLGPSNQL